MTKKQVEINISNNSISNKTPNKNIPIMTIPNKTPNKNIPINAADKRRLVGVSLSGPGRHTLGGVQVVYSRTVDIDGFIFDIVETEYVTDQDFEKVKRGNPEVLKALFNLAVQSAMRPFDEVLRLLDLRK